MKIRTILLTAGALALSCAAGAQECWSLEECIDYAQKHNVGVQQRSLEVEQGSVQLSTARNSRLPDLNASLGANMYFGRGPSRDGTYTDNSQLSGSLGISTSVPVFQGMRIGKQIKGAKLDLTAAMQDMERAKEDVSVNVMTLYLQVLFDKELVKVAEQQLVLNTQQTERSRQLVDEGRKPVSTLYESQALQANSELALVQARNNLTISLLNLSQALNRPSAEGFDVVTPALDSLQLEALCALGSPEQVYDYADAHRPVIAAERTRLAGSENSLRLARSYLSPSITFSAGYGTNIYNSFATGAINPEFWSQVRNNGNEYLSLSVNIPIFNRRVTRNNIRSAALAVRSQQLTLTEAQQSLRKQIEQAYYQVGAAYAKYRAANQALTSARIAFAYEQERSAAGRSTIFDYNDARTRMEKAESELIQAKYEFVFSAKILDFYKGEPLRI